MDKNKILIIEDEPKVAFFIKKGLEEQSYKVDVANDGYIGKKMIISNKYDLIIADVNLPKLNGFQLCIEIREMNINIPILMLTALGTTDDKISGFESGADDYLVKPFEFRELIARVKVLLKRTKIESPIENILKCTNLEMNLDRKTVTRDNKFIDLTAKEFMLLEYLLRNKNRVISRSDIAEKIWEIKFDTGTNVIDVYINFLRKKIDRDFSPKLIFTHIGLGYMLKEESEL
ncbi:MAG: response regulator transcription factor [Bacteroidia bacterium]|nr:response regulator transcription factor [Bacteroidia bacterium]